MVDGNKNATWAELYAALREHMPSVFEAQQLFAHVSGWHTHDLPQIGGQTAGPRDTKRLAALCARRLEGEPLQYLLGEWEFYGLPFYVGEGVLIPRADTETLVDVARGLLERAAEPRPVVLDLCAGTGAVAIAVAHCVPTARVTAVELSVAAYCFLEKNCARNAVAVEAVRADLYEYTPPEKLSLITANPPYIPSGTLDTLQAEVQLEPVMALDGGADGLDFYRGILERYLPFLKPGGALCVEVGFDQADAVRALFIRRGLAETEMHHDLAGIARVVSGIIK